jgi:hypothetical protein
MVGDVTTSSGERLQIGAKGVLFAETESFEEVDIAHVKECIRWFDRAESTEEPTVSSFWLAHVVQASAGRSISNGAVIVAAHRMGFPIERGEGETSANVLIGVARHCIDEYDCGCGHP